MRSLWLTPPRYWKGREIADNIILTPSLKSWCRTAFKSTFSDIGNPG
jgi:hypothetical protein